MPARMTAREWGQLATAVGCALAPSVIAALVLLRVVFR